jgi:hypothetical protein
MATTAGSAAGPAGPEPMPSYAQLVQRGWGSALAAARGCADCGWGLARRGLAEHAHLAPPELLLLALGALGLTALRSAATARLFRVSATRGARDAGTPGGGGGGGDTGRCPRRGTWGRHACADLRGGGCLGGVVTGIWGGRPGTTARDERVRWMRGCGRARAMSPGHGGPTRVGFGGPHAVRGRTLFFWGRRNRRQGHGEAWHTEAACAMPPPSSPPTHTLWRLSYCYGQVQVTGTAWWFSVTFQPGLGTKATPGVSLPWR